jgi:hypothetical protein
MYQYNTYFLKATGIPEGLDASGIKECHLTEGEGTKACQFPDSRDTQ